MDGVTSRPGGRGQAATRKQIGVEQIASAARRDLSGLTPADVRCSGRGLKWLRTSRVFGRNLMERQIKKNLDRMAEMVKELGTIRKCFRLGRKNSDESNRDKTTHLAIKNRKKSSQNTKD